MASRRSHRERAGGARRARGPEGEGAELGGDDELEVQEGAARAEQAGEEGGDRAAGPCAEVAVGVDRPVEVAKGKGLDLQVHGGDQSGHLVGEGFERGVSFQGGVEGEEAEAEGQALPLGDEHRVEAGQGVQPAPGGAGWREGGERHSRGGQEAHPAAVALGGAARCGDRVAVEEGEAVRAEEALRAGQGERGQLGLLEGEDLGP